MSKKKTTTTQQQQTVTPTNPAWVTGAVQGQQDLVNRLKDRDPTDFVAPASPLQNMAFGLGGGLAARMQGGTTLDFEGLMGTQPQPSSPIPTLYNPNGLASQTIQTGGGRPAGRGVAPGGAMLPTGGSGGVRRGTVPASDPTGGGSPPPAPSVQGSQPRQAVAPMQTGGGSPLQTASAPTPLGGGSPPAPPALSGTPENPLNARNDAPNGFAGSIFGQNGSGFFPQTGVSIPGGIIEATGGETPEQQAGVDPSVFGQVDPMALGSPNPNDFFAGAGLLAGQAGLAGANTVGGVAGSFADTLGPASGYGASGPATAGGYRASGPASAGGFMASGPAAAGGYDAAGRAAIERATASQGQAGGAAGVERANASLLGDPRLYEASLAGARGADAISAGSGERVNLGGYNAVTGQAARIGDLPTFEAAQMTEADIQRFMNPYLSDVVDTTLADFDENAGVVRARQAANAAGAGAFGGSRFGVREAQTEGELGRGRASTAAGLRADAFNTALSAAGDDVGRRQQAGLANFSLLGERAFADAAAENQFGLANVDAQNRAAAFGADAANTGQLANQDVDSRFRLADADAANRAEMFSADAANRASLTNAGLLTDAAAYGANAANEFDRLNQAAQTQVGLANADAFNRSSLDAARRGDAMTFANMDAANRAALANSDAFNRSELDAAGRADAAGAFGADAANRSALDFAGRSDAAGAFGADAANRSALDFAGRADAAGAFGADALNRSLLDYAGRTDSAGQFKAGQENQFALNQFDANNQANFRNADALNTTSRFNAGQQDNALIRQLQAAGLLGDLGSTIGSEDRANIGLLAGLGGQQRSIDSEFRNAEPTLVQLLASLQAQQPYQLFQGQNTTESGTTTERIRDPMGTLGSALVAGGSVIPNGAGKILFSDARLKRNIETVGYDAAGRRWAEYEYVWGGPRQIGVIAQEVAMTDPHAVTLHGSGYLMVNYGAL